MKPWEQLRELNFGFDDFDVLLVYYLDVERVSPYIGSINPFAILSDFATRGFEFPTLDPRNGRKDFYMFEDRGKRLTTNLAQALGQLSTSIHQSLTPPLPGHIVIRMPSHIGKQFIPADHDRFLGQGPGKNKDLLPDMCIIPRLQLSTDTITYGPLVTLWWARLRLLDASMLL